MFGYLARLLATFYALWPSYGFAIVALTVTVYLALLPLTLRQARAMTAMQQLQPQLRTLRERHTGDRQRLNQETVALYQRHAVNPAASFLPMLLQLPVLIVMYRVIRGLTYDDPTTGDAAPRYLDHGSTLYHALRDHGGRMVSAGMDLSTSALSPHGSLLATVPFVALAGMVVAAAVWQQRLSLRRAAGNPLPAASRQVMRVMPAFTGFLALSVPAGVTLYYLISSLFRIGQQQLVIGRGASTPGMKVTGDELSAPAAIAVEQPTRTSPTVPRSGSDRDRKRRAAKRRKRVRRP